MSHRSAEQRWMRSFDRFLLEWSRRDFIRNVGGAVAWSAFLAGGMSALEACANASSGRSSSQAAVKPVKGGNLIEPLVADIGGINPLKSLGSLDRQVYTYLYDALLTIDGNNNLLPQMASALPKQSADGLSYTFTLRPNIKWTDGQPLTADDVVFTYQLMYDPQYNDFSSPYRGELSTYVQAVTAPDPHTVVFKLKKPYVPLLANHCLHGILPKHALKDFSAAELNTAAYNSAPGVTSGPFKFVEWKKGDHVTLARNDLYWGGAPYVDNFVTQLNITAENVTNNLLNGSADQAVITSASDVPRLKASPNLEVLVFPTPTIVRYNYQLDPSKPTSKIFSSKAVRQALLYAVDRDGMVNATYFNGLNGSVADSPWPSFSWAHNPNVTPKYTFNKAKAESMLDTEGWKKGADGVRTKDGVKMAFSITAGTTNEYQKNAQILQQNWHDIGAEVSIKALPNAQIVALVSGTRAFDVVLLALLAEGDPDESVYWSSASASAGGQNALPYKNPQVDQLLEQAASTTDQSKRKQAYYQIQNILLDDLPAAPLIEQKGIFAFNKRVHGLNATNFTGYTWRAPRPFMKDVFISQQ